jgi:type I restriction enzyme S subunit
MRSNYKQLGNYIEQFDIRNKDCNNSLGLEAIKGISSISKSFIKTKANLVGVSPGNYKIVEPNQFGFNPNTARMGDKIPIALNSGRSNVLVSSIYPTFKIIDANLLLPEYLMMWLRRPEFDRYARFKSHGSAREIFDYGEMCEVELPVPSIEKQREIVKEYNAVVNRIKLNEQLNRKLEETAQVLYKHWFLDFEFPNENGQPYKTSGGRMVYSEELDQEIPLGWKPEFLSDMVNQVCVGFVGSCFDYYTHKELGVPMLRTTDISDLGMTYNNLKYVTEEFHLKNKKSQLRIGDILVARHGSNGMPAIYDKDEEANCLNAIIIKPNVSNDSKLLHCFLTSTPVKEQIQGSLGGSVQDVLNTKIVSSLIFVGQSDINLKIKKHLNLLQSNIEIIRKELRFLELLKSVFLSKMSKVKTFQTSQAV